MLQPNMPPVRSKSFGLAFTSLITALLGLGIVPVILGHVALAKIKRSMGALPGKGMAIAGLVIGYVQIAVFIPMLIIGVKAHKRGSERAGCILNQRNVQQVVRSYQGMNNLQEGAPIDWKAIFGPDKFMAEPVCPAHGKYTFKTTMPKIGEMAAECSLSGEPEKHVPADHSDW